MNFYYEKEKAKKKTLYFLLAFSLGIIVFISLIVFFIYYFYKFYKELHSDINYDLDIFQASALVLIFIIISIVYKFFQLRQGGSAVAESLGAKLLALNTVTQNEVVLLNVVEEMSIASGISLPQVYILEDSSLNAFAAGYDFDDAIICVTRGLIDTLERQELQGVIAHEFSHIFNGDMRLNIKATSALFGLLSVGNLGYEIINASFYSNSSNSNSNVESYAQMPKKSSSDNRSFPIYLLILALGLLVLGFLGTFIGNIIKAMISRQREFLADASAVQYTRDTSGIANALKRIGANKNQGFLSSPSASTFSHFYFTNGVKGFVANLFATHPPLDERILRIEPNWDGKYIYGRKKTSTLKREKKDIKKEIFEAISAISILNQVKNGKETTQEDIDKASDFIQNLPKDLYAMTKDTLSAQGVILALLASDTQEVEQKEINLLKSKNLKIFNQVRRAFISLSDISRKDYLIILQLSLPTLRGMSVNQYENFRDLVTDLIWANNNISLFEWNLKHLILYPLDIYFNFIKPTVVSSKNLKDFKKEVSFFVSFLTTLEYKTQEKAKEIFDKVTQNEKLDFIPHEKLDFNMFDKIYVKFTHLNVDSRKKLLKMAIQILSKNEVISPQNQEMLQAMSVSLRIPLKFEE